MTKNKIIPGENKNSPFPNSEHIHSQKMASRYQSSFEHSRDAMNIFTLDRKIIDVNLALIQISGYTKRELLAMNLDDLYPETMTDEGKKRLKSLKAEIKLPLFESFLLTKKGQKIPVEIAVTSLKNWGDEDVVCQGNVRNITDKKKVEEDLQKAEKLKSIGALAGGIAHNFNNIMTSLFGNISLAKMELLHHPEAIHYLDNAEDSMKEGIQLTKQLLTFAKGGDPIKETLEIDRFVKETVSFNLSGSNVRLTFSCEPDLWKVKADKTQLAQVISNIVINARQAMPSGGKLKIKIENSNMLKDNLLTISKGKYIKLSFTDTGGGISHENKERIFDPYFTTKNNGSGMGLSICYSIIYKHNGHIRVSSQKNQGTTITIYLKAAISDAIQDETISPQNPEVSDHNKKRILVMDDEAHIRNLAKRILEKFGYNVELANDGEQAISLYKEFNESNVGFHLLIMDLTIPGGMGGKEASKKILDYDPKARIIVSSGYSNDPVMANFSDFGLLDIIPKPYHLEELRSVVEKNLE